MTNEERVEERLIHAHERGYYDKVMTQFKELEIRNPNENKYRLYDIVCDTLKSDWLKENNKSII
jgi:hypothetical protein